MFHLLLFTWSKIIPKTFSLGGKKRWKALKYQLLKHFKISGGFSVLIFQFQNSVCKYFQGRDHASTKVYSCILDTQPQSCLRSLHITTETLMRVLIFLMSVKWKHCYLTIHWTNSRIMSLVIVIAMHYVDCLGTHY